MQQSKSTVISDVRVTVEANGDSNTKISVQERKKEPYSSPWGFIDFNELAFLLSNKSITREAFFVLSLLLKIMEYENKITISQTWIAKKLEIHKTQVNRSFKNLIENGVLFKEIDEFDRKFYRVNPDICWRGSSASLNRYRKQRADQELQKMFA